MSRDKPKLRRIGSTYKEIYIGEITGSTQQELVAGITGYCIVLRRFEFSCTIATVFSLLYGSTSVTTKYTLSDLGYAGEKDLNTILPTGEGLDALCSVDPAEGWIRIEYDVVTDAVSGY